MFVEHTAFTVKLFLEWKEHTVAFCYLLNGNPLMSSRIASN